MKMIRLSSTRRASVWGKYAINMGLLEQCLVYAMCSVSENQYCYHHPQHVAMPQNLFLYLQKPPEVGLDMHVFGQGRVFLAGQPTSCELPKAFWGLCITEDSSLIRTYFPGCKDSLDPPFTLIPVCSKVKLAWVLSLKFIFKVGAFWLLLAFQILSDKPFLCHAAVFLCFSRGRLPSWFLLFGHTQLQEQKILGFLPPIC